MPPMPRPRSAWALKRSLDIRRWYASSSGDVYKKFGDTLALPKTSYNAKAPSEKEVAQLIKETGSDLYQWQEKTLPKETEVVFHDGPPYANGGLHMGHALNKILKDIINRYNLIQGKRVNYIPGWDCHGLPIELEAMAQATKKLGKRKVEGLSIEERRKFCRETALSVVENQMEEFKGFGVMADWDNNTYKTLAPDYVIRQLKVFRQMMTRGLISRKNRPVYWSVESQTALAESELQYGEKKSTAAVVKYKIEPSEKVNVLLAKFDQQIDDLYTVIWTTTPWTLVSNRAIAVHPDIEYGIFHSTDHGHVIVAVDRIQELGEGTLLEPTFLGSDIIGIEYSCLLKGPSVTFPILGGPHVTATSGTGLVHSAPGHGMDDYLMCVPHGMEPYSPIDDKGRYTSDVHDSFQHLIGLDARKQGQEGVLEMAQKANALVSIDRDYIHSTPFDWRSKTPVLVRSTPQFFANVSSIKEKALNALNRVNFYPTMGRNRLRAFTDSRAEWCISRQRVWGVPIPALYHKETGELLLSDDSVSHIISVMESQPDEGLSKWFRDEEDVSEWLPPVLKDQGFEYRKGLETMDVWFDSGTSWTMFDKELTGQGPVSEYYLEGTDQHRGWFQSSLLTKVATSCEANPSAPYKNIITNGMVLDAHGRKMSKSLKNVVVPADVKQEPKTGKSRDKLGIDGLRLWCAQSDYTADISLSPVSLVQLSAVLKKIRLTFKFLLGNLNSYDGTPVDYQQLHPTDKKALADLYDFNKAIKSEYDRFAFNRVVQLVQNHMNTNLSAFYFDIVKDRIYADSTNGISRRSIQYAFSQILQTYIAVLSPLVPLLTQQVWKHVPGYINKDNAASPFMLGWPEPQEEWRNEQIQVEFDTIKKVRDGVLLAMEKGRSEKVIRSSLGTRVYLDVPQGQTLDLLYKYQEHLPAIFITSDVIINDDPTALDNCEWKYPFRVGNVEITIVPPNQEKCPRCWQYTAPTPESLCRRCDDVLSCK